MTEQEHHRPLLGRGVNETLSFRYPRNVCFKCGRCSLCCGDTEKKTRSILLLETETTLIGHVTSKSAGEFAERIEGFEPYVYRMKKTETGKCVFLKDNFCSVYKSRPLVCKFYPFQLRNVGRQAHSFEYTDECPRIGKGPRLKKGYFLRLFKRSLELMKEDSRVNGSV